MTWNKEWAVTVQFVHYCPRSLIPNYLADQASFSAYKYLSFVSPNQVQLETICNMSHKVDALQFWGKRAVFRKGQCEHRTLASVSIGRHHLKTDK